MSGMSGQTAGDTRYPEGRRAMLTIDLTFGEAEMLADILESFLGDLRLEIADTEKKALRDRMKAEEHVIKELLRKLDAREQIRAENENPPVA